MSLQSDIAMDMIANGVHKTGLLAGLGAYVTNPGCAAMMRYRLYSRMYRSGGLWKIPGKLLWILNTRIGCYLAPTAKIGPGLRLPHPTSVVIGGGAVLGARVTMYQNTTIGRIEQDKPDMPVIGGGCVLYVGATVLGPTQLSENTIVGAFSVVRPSKDERK